MLSYTHASDLVESVRKRLTEPLPSIPFPWWPKFTELWNGGLRMRETTLLCAPTGAGKTQLLANIACQMWEQEVPTFVAPVETGNVDFLVRMISVLERKDFNTGKAYRKEGVDALLERYRPAIESRPLTIATYDERVDIDEMLTMIRYQHQEYGSKIILLDNLNFFLKVTSSTMEKAEMDDAVHRIIQLSKELPIHIILVVHPKKTEHGRVVSEFDIKGSSTAVQEAFNVLLWNKPDKEGPPMPPNNREAVFRKLRMAGQNVGISFMFKYDWGRFDEIGKIEVYK